MFFDLEAVREKLTEAYLEAWIEVAPLPTLREYFEVAQRLAPIHIALNHARFLSYNIDSQWDMTGAVPINLNKFI